ncbi:unnamed protein product [Diamesa tonsa]
MELATFDKFNEAEFLLVKYRNHSTKKSNVWIGYTDENHEGVWTSEGGKLLDKNISFHGGEPTNGKGHDYVENCLEIWFSNNEYKFNDNQCNIDHHFICEHKTEISYVDELKANLENQKKHENCYTKTVKTWFLSRTLETFAKATEVCQSNNMQLTSFNTKEERDQFLSFVSSTNKIDAWTGYTDEVRNTLERKNQIIFDCPLLKIANNNDKIVNTPRTENHFYICESVDTTNVLEDKKSELVDLKSLYANMEMDYKKQTALLISKLKLVVDENENLKNQLKASHHSSSVSSQDRFNKYENRINELEKQVNKLTDALHSLIGNNKSAMFCDYDNINNVYSCSTEGLEILKENVEIAVTGDHHVDKANEDVIELNISNSKTKFLSNSLFHYFERLRKIQIVKSQLQSLSNGVFSGAEYLRKVFIQEYDHCATKIIKSLYVSKTEKASWAKSHDICKSIGMELATFDLPNEAEQLLVNYRLYSTKKTNVWVGYTDENHEGVWISNKGKLMHENISFHDGEPNNYDGVEHCLAIALYSNNQYKYNDIHCSLIRHIMCEHKTAISSVDDCKVSLEKQRSEFSMMNSEMNAKMDSLKTENIGLKNKVQTLEKLL